MAFLNEFLTYLFKFIVLGGVTIAAVLCGAKYKNSKIAKSASESEKDTEDDVDTVDENDAKEDMVENTEDTDIEA